MPYRVSRHDFDALVEESIKELPPEFKKLLTNILIIVEDYPPRDDKKIGGSKGLLLGLFEGVPYTEKGSLLDMPYPSPNKITLFQKNIENICLSERELRCQIKSTLLHEVGHYFGLSEKELKKHGV